MLDGLTHNEVCSSLDLELNKKRVFKAGASSGKSGSFFFFSADNRFIIKTLQGNERENLLRILGPMT